MDPGQSGGAVGGQAFRDLPGETAAPGSIEALLPRRRLVVVIGIDDYPNLPKLRCAVSDAVGVQELLVERFGFEAPLPPLLNQEATRRAIEELIQDRLPAVIQPEDALLLFFAGHGTTRVTPLDGLVVETGYLAPADARGPQQYSDLIDMEELLRKIGRLNVRHIVVVLDACHSGMALGGAVSRYRSMETYVHRLARNRSRRVITSARRDEPALDNGPIPDHSLFTGTLIRGLTSGEADLDGNGVITFSELALFLQQRVGQESGSRQTPDHGAFHLDDRGELLISAGPPRAGAAVAPDQRAAPAPGALTPPGPPPRPGRFTLAAIGAPIVAALGIGIAAYRALTEEGPKTGPLAAPLGTPAPISLPAPGPDRSGAKQAPPPPAPADDVPAVESGPCPAGMSRIPGGRFQVARGAYHDDPHDVVIESFCLDRTEVTVEAYATCVDTGRCSPPYQGMGCNWSIQANRRHPINCVDWNQADIYCRRQGKRLPTNREWEYARRGGGEYRMYPWGARPPSPRLLNACGVECDESRPLYKGEDGWAETAPVMSYPEGRGRWELHDLEGNVAEWTASWYCPYPKDGALPCDANTRVLRGSTYRTSSVDWIAPFHRGDQRPSLHSPAYGLRCARTLREP